MIGLGLSLGNGAPAGRRNWHRDARYAIPAFGGGADLGAGLIADFVRGRYALPANMSAEDILAAPAADVAAAVRVCAFADVIDLTSSGKWVTGPDGVLAYQPVPWDWTHGRRGLLLEGPSTNTVINNTMQNATIGVIGGGGGNLPSTWSRASSGAEIDMEVVGLPVVNGVECIDIRIFGTATAALAGGFLQMSAAAQTPVTEGEIVTGSAWVQLVAGTLPNANTILRLEGQAAASAGGAITAAFMRRLSTWTVPADTTTVRLSLRTQWAAGQEIDCTFRIGLPQIEKQAQATSPIKTSGTALTRAADMAQLTPRAAAVLQRESVGLVVQGQGIWGSAGRMIGGANVARLIGLSVSEQQVALGNAASIAVATGVSTPLPAFGVASGWDAAGKAGAYNGGAVVSNGGALDTILTTICLGRAATGSYGNGHYASLIAWPGRPANAVLPGKAVPYAP